MNINGGAVTISHWMHWGVEKYSGRLSWGVCVWNAFKVSFFFIVVNTFGEMRFNKMLGRFKIWRTLHIKKVLSADFQNEYYNNLNNQGIVCYEW